MFSKLTFYSKKSLAVRSYLQWTRRRVHLQKGSARCHGYQRRSGEHICDYAQVILRVHAKLEKGKVWKVKVASSLNSLNLWRTEECAITLSAFAMNLG